MNGFIGSYQHLKRIHQLEMEAQGQRKQTARLQVILNFYFSVKDTST